MSESSAALFQKIFGHLPNLEQSILAHPFYRDGASRTGKLLHVCQALECGYSPYEIFKALSSTSVGAEDQHRATVFLAIAHANIGPVGFDQVFQDWLDYSEDLLGKVGSAKLFPAFNEVETAVMVKRGISLVHRADGSLRPHDELQRFAGKGGQAFSFIQSALLHDDLEALEHLESTPGMAKRIDHDDIVEFVDSIVHAKREFAEKGEEHFEGLPPIPSVTARLYTQRAMRDYWLAITGAISKGSMEALEASFDPVLSVRGGSDLVLDLLNDETITLPAQRSVATAYVAKHVAAGADMVDAYHVMTLGRVYAKDFSGAPVPLDVVVSRSLSQDSGVRRNFQWFLLMYTPEQILEHHSGQDCLKVLYRMTGDLKYMACIESLEFRGQEFLKELGV